MEGTSGLRWVVDPLDGTTNFLFGIPQWCVSIACEDDAGGIAAVVHDPIRDETFTAARGEGAFLGERRLRISAKSDLADALIADRVLVPAGGARRRGRTADARSPPRPRRPAGGIGRSRPRLDGGRAVRRVLRGADASLGPGGRRGTRARGRRHDERAGSDRPIRLWFGGRRAGAPRRPPGSGAGCRMNRMSASTV